MRSSNVIGRLSAAPAGSVMAKTKAVTGKRRRMAARPSGRDGSCCRHRSPEEFTQPPPSRLLHGEVDDQARSEQEDEGEAPDGSEDKAPVAEGFAGVQAGEEGLVLVLLFAEKFAGEVVDEFLVL